MENIQNKKPMTTGEWVVTLLITFIPLVGLIMLFVWAFGSGTPVCKANWAKATLIWMAIGLVLFLLFGVLGTLFVSTLF